MIMLVGGVLSTHSFDSMLIPIFSSAVHYASSVWLEIMCKGY